MTETICSCCELLGKPPAQINFIIATGAPYSLVYHKVKYLFSNYSATPSYKNDSQLTTYATLSDIGDKIFNLESHSLQENLSVSTKNHTCCNGFNYIPISIDDISDVSEFRRIQKTIIELLDSATEEKAIKCNSATWVLFIGSKCLEASFLDIFLQLSDSESSRLRFTLTVICFLVDENRLFENCLSQGILLKDYKSIIYPEYSERVKRFFSLLDSSKYLQEATLIVDERTVSTENQLQLFLKDIFHKSSKYRKNTDKHRSDMAKLLTPPIRTVRDIRDVRNALLSSYYRTTSNRLKPIFDDLHQSSTATNAARQIVRIVLDEFRLMNDEQLRVHKRLLTLGFSDSSAKKSNSIAAQLIRYALQMLKNNNDNTNSIPLIYAISLTICTLGCHFFFRHELFNHTPEIFELSLLLVNQRQYPLLLTGLRLFITILNADDIEYKYAKMYLAHDLLTARKVLDAIRWILSPYQKLKVLWEEEENKEKNTGESESTEEESTLYIAEKNCFNHTINLVERCYLSNIASLFCGSADHCQHVTVTDVQNFAEIIDILSVFPFTSWHYSKRKVHPSLLLISQLCALLTPILLYGQPSVNSTILDDMRLLSSVPKTIDLLFKQNNIDEDIINRCIYFYTQLVQSKCKEEAFEDDSESEDETFEDDSESEDEIKTSETTTTTTSRAVVQDLNSFIPLNLSKNLITSYYDLYKNIQNICLPSEKSVEQEHIQVLLTDEWKKLDIVQLEHNYKQLKQEHVLLQEELLQLRNELQRTQLERDEFRKENINMSKEIDNLKLIPNTKRTTECNQTSITVPIDHNSQTNTINDLQNLSPNEITPEQAEQFIREIYRRRTTFNDDDMRKSICGSLKHLGSDLYSSSVHFLYELIQNAEDNFYEETILPYLRIEVNHTYILLSNNEKGLRAKDVLAICSLAVSTKTIREEHIGEKGVGFKSVFAASNEPMLISHAWKFRFQVPGIDAMSYITPLWTTDLDVPNCISEQISRFAQHTHLYLPLKSHADISEKKLFLDQVIKAIDPCILLNMRRLKKLDIIDQRNNIVTTIEKQIISSTKLEAQENVTFETSTFLDLTGSIIKLHTTTGYTSFRVYTCYINVQNLVEEKCTQKTRLLIAFPCEHNYSLTSTVYSGLPVCNLGFNFLFNADFQLVTNRESVRENVRFNTLIRDHLSELFVYLLLHDIDLKKDINRYCPTLNTHVGQHSSWWLVMIDRINELITKYLSTLFGIEIGKKIRYANKDLTSLVSNEQLYNCADIHVIDPDDSFLTLERLRSFQIQPLTILDVLDCFPRRDETPANEFRQQFRLWTYQQDEKWWSQVFSDLSKMKKSEMSNKIVQVPIFRLPNSQQREYLPTNNSLLFISDDLEFRMWKNQLILLKYSSKSERTALLESNHVQLLTEERMIEIIRHHHLQLALSSAIHTTDTVLIEEIWNDLFYVKNHLKILNKSIPFLVPVNGAFSLTPIQNATLPTIFGIDIRSFIGSKNSSIIRFPYHNTSNYQFYDILQWEYFLLEMKCHSASIYLPENQSINELPILPILDMFKDERSARLSESIFLYQNDDTKNYLQRFPVADNSTIQRQISPMFATFDEAIVDNLSTLPRINVPSYCRSLAKHLGIRVEYDLSTCVTVLQLLTDEKNKNIDLYIKWLTHLQLYIRQQLIESNSKQLLQSCLLYFPDQDDFYSLTDIFILSNNEEHINALSSISKYLKLQIISPLTNHVYWPFKNLFNHLGCLSTSTIRISHACTAIYLASHDRNNFFPLGNCTTTLTENGMELLIVLYQYLEYLILKCVENNSTDSELYDTIIKNKPSKVACGSREDLEWRFSFTCNNLSERLKKLTGIQSERKKIGLPTINRRIITKKNKTIVYSCFEMNIIESLSRNIETRRFILPLIARTCPLILASFDVDYIERRAKILWKHQNQNLEFSLNNLTKIFRDTLNCTQIEVMSVKYADITVVLSDDFLIESINDINKKRVDQYSIMSNYPFWIFNNTVLLCIGFEKSDKKKAIIATYALTTLLHKRKHIPFDEAKSISQQKINTCQSFRSECIANVACTNDMFYSYIDFLFPDDHHSVESIVVSIGNNCTMEKDFEKVLIATVAPDRIPNDEMYRNRVKKLNHISQNSNKGITCTNSIIVDGSEQIRIGQNAEHFFFVYLQNYYGSINVTPINNWCSSSRRVIYPQYQRNIDDSAGYDFVLHDTQQLFLRGSGAKTIYCYFEIKGIAGSYDEAHTSFHVSQNELNVCNSIVHDAKRREDEAYFIVIIENCLDPEQISFGTIINCNENFHRLKFIADSYECRILPSSSNVNYFTRPTNRDYDSRQLDEFSGLEYSNSNTTTQSAYRSNNYSQTNNHRSSNRPYPSQQQQTFPQKSCNNNFDRSPMNRRK